MKVAVGVDVGATFLKVGLVRGKKIWAQHAFPTAPLQGPAQFVEGIARGVGLLVPPDKKIAGIGVGVPGLVSYAHGVVRSVVNLKGRWKDVPLQAMLSRRLRLRVAVDNDVNLMTLAEWKLGAGRGAKNLVCLTLGTGVGGGLILEGRLYRGGWGGAGEIGHIPIAQEGPRCSCGGRGCLERFVGNREIIRWVRAQLAAGEKSILPKLVHGNLGKLQPETIDEGCRLGDPLALKTWVRVGETLGFALAGVVNLLSPERIVIGGGIAKAGRWLFPAIRRTLRHRAMHGMGSVCVVPAQLGPSAGMIGAALLIQGIGESD